MIHLKILFLVAFWKDGIAAGLNADHAAFLNNPLVPYRDQLMTVRQYLVDPPTTASALNRTPQKQQPATQDALAGLADVLKKALEQRTAPSQQTPIVVLTPGQGPQPQSQPQPYHPYQGAPLAPTQQPYTPQPFNPVNPANPVNPFNPVNPVNLVNPASPANPTNPSPVNSVNPTVSSLELANQRKLKELHQEIKKLESSRTPYAEALRKIQQEVKTMHNSQELLQKTLLRWEQMKQQQFEQTQRRLAEELQRQQEERQKQQESFERRSQEEWRQLEEQRKKFEEAQELLKRAASEKKKEYYPPSSPMQNTTQQANVGLLPGSRCTAMNAYVDPKSVLYNPQLDPNNPMQYQASNPLTNPMVNLERYNPMLDPCSPLFNPSHPLNNPGSIGYDATKDPKSSKYQVNLVLGTPNPLLQRPKVFSQKLAVPRPALRSWIRNVIENKAEPWSKRGTLKKDDSILSHVEAQALSERSTGISKDLPRFSDSFALSHQPVGRNELQHLQDAVDEQAQGTFETSQIRDLLSTPCSRKTATPHREVHFVQYERKPAYYVSGRPKRRCGCARKRRPARLHITYESPKYATFPDTNADLASVHVITRRDWKKTIPPLPRANLCCNRNILQPKERNYFSTSSYNDII